MSRIAVATLEKLAAYGSFFLHDPAMPDEDPDDVAALNASRADIVGASEHRVYLQTAQRAVAVHVPLEVWDSPPAGPGSQPWEYQHDVAFTCPTGRVIVENTGDGPVALEPIGDQELALPSGVTQVAVRAYAHGLDTGDEVDRVYSENMTTPFSELHAVLQQLKGRERYLLQLWPA